MMPSENIQLNWVQPSALERHFELHSENSVLGMLHFEKAPTAYGSVMSKNSETDRWLFKGSGFLHKERVTIRKAGANEDMAVYHPQFWGGGWLEFVEGSRFRWTSKGFWVTKWNFFNARGELLYSLK